MNIIHFYKKVLNRISVEKNRIWKYVDLNKYSLTGYHSFKNADSFKDCLKTMLGAFDGSLIAGIDECYKKVIVSSADQALQHIFDLLGSGPVKLDPIDWHQDFKKGAKWQKVFYRDLTTQKGADIKVPWELSRCQHLLWLGEAYLLTNDGKYAKEIIDEINWWIDDNSLMYSVNWKCAMDVAFRAVNWMFVLNMISDYDGLDDKFVNKVLRSLWQHGFFIRNNLERQIPYSNNHYASDIVGLLYIGALFRHTSKGKRWLKFAQKEYHKEVLTQVLPSGVHYERSVSYHRLMTELFSYPVYMLRRIGEEVPKNVIERIRRMYDYVATYTKPNCLAPLIADNDDGRFVPFIKRDFRRHDYLINPDSIENRFVTFGCSPLFCSFIQGTQFYSDAGVAIIKHERNYLYINHGGYSKCPKETDTLIGTHTHNDLLSFELNLNGEDVLVDAGTYLYTSSKEGRDAFRSTAKHNTIVVDGEEQNGMINSFVLKCNLHKSVLKQISEMVFEGEYCTIIGQMYHNRHFDFNGGMLIITDTIRKTGTGHEAKLFLHFAAGLSPEVMGDELVVKDIANISFNLKPDQIVVEEDTLSPSYGVFVESKTANVIFEFDNDITIKTTIKK